MTLLEQIIIYLIVIAALSTGGYLYYLDQTTNQNALKLYNQITTSPKLSSASNETSKNQSDETCVNFFARFGTSAEELVNFINDEPDSKNVIKGYRHLFGEVISLTPGKNLPLFVELDSNGKIITFQCVEKKLERDYSQDIDFTIPEIDLAQIIRYRETLETKQTASYLQNVTTNPPGAKNIILQRIQALE